MNRALAIVLTAVVIVAALVIVVVADGKPAAPDAVQSMAADYATYLSRTGTQWVQVQRIVRAAHPERFRQEMSKATFSNGIFYNTTYNLQKMVESGRVFPGASQGRAVSYPPTEFWCALLSDGGVIAVGQHHDMFNAEWILHEMADGSVGAQVGCADLVR
jgi:hypothetical protein